MCPFHYTAFAVSSKIRIYIVTCNRLNSNSRVVVVTLTKRPKSVRSRCVIEYFGAVFVLSLSFLILCWCRRFCHMTWSDLFLFLCTCKFLFYILWFYYGKLPITWKSNFFYDSTAPSSLKFNAGLANFWNLNAKFRFLFVILFLKATELAKFWKLAKLLSKTRKREFVI